MKAVFLVSLAMAIALMLTATPALAYIDPGTGSFLLQGIIAAVIGAGVTIKLFWHRIKAALGSKSVTEDDDDDE